MWRMSGKGDVDELVNWCFEPSQDVDDEWEGRCR